VRVRDTAHLEFLLVSPALLETAAGETLERVARGAFALDAGDEVWAQGM